MNPDEILKPCPFCGGKAKLTLYGNDRTKRKAQVKCTSCFTKQITGAIYKPLTWCQEIAIETWNKRVN